MSITADCCERFFVFSSESERSEEPEGNYIAPAPAVYAVPAVDLTPAPAVHAVPAPGVEYSAPAPAVKRLSPVVAPVVEYIAPAPAVLCPFPVVECTAPAPAVLCPSPVVDCTAPAPAPVAVDASALVSPPTPVVEYIASVPPSTPAVSSPPATRVQSRQSAHRVSTEVPTVSSRRHGQWRHTERILRAARRGYFFRQLKKRDTQLAAQLTSLGKACEVARGSPVASLLVPVAMREQGLSSKLLAFEKQLEDHEVAVLELERLVAVLELGENFKRLSDLVNETQTLELGRRLAVVELHDKFKQLSDQVVLMDTMEDRFEQFRKAVLLQLTIDGDGGGPSDGLRWGVSPRRNLEDFLILGLLALLALGNMVHYSSTTLYLAAFFLGV